MKVLGVILLIPMGLAVVFAVGGIAYCMWFVAKDFWEANEGYDPDAAPKTLIGFLGWMTLIGIMARIGIHLLTGV